MTEETSRRSSAFRINLEQQSKRAKELLRAAKGGNANALGRIGAIAGVPVDVRECKLADAQLAIARELGFASWPKLKAHADAMEFERSAIEHAEIPLDADMRTLHIRCGSDIEPALRRARFKGDFLEHAYPYAQGPATKEPAKQAHFLISAFGGNLKTAENELLQRCREEAALLEAAGRAYTRIVLWMEHDSYDQLILVRCLESFAVHGPPEVLELIDVEHFPGSARFLGLGQLPAEALRLLWRSRRRVSAAQLDFGQKAWAALESADPRPLAAIMLSGAESLPHLARALHRHLRELPSVEAGLGLTERLLLEMLEPGPSSIERLFRRLRDEVEPLPWLGDWGFLHVIASMERAREAPFVRHGGSREGPALADELELTGLGMALVSGETDWLDYGPPSRWVGGVEIPSVPPSWRWDEAERRAVRG